MADNYRAVSHGLAEVQFISPNLFKFLTQGQHAGSTVRRHQSRVRFPATDQFLAETRNTSLKLRREADCTICSA